MSEDSKRTIYKIATGLEPSKNILLPLILHECKKKELNTEKAVKNINNIDNTLLNQNSSI